MTNGALTVGQVWRGIRRSRISVAIGSDGDGNLILAYDRSFPKVIDARIVEPGLALNDTLVLIEPIGIVNIVTDGVPLRYWEQESRVLRGKLDAKSEKP
jgi:hypothetical protein